MKLARPACTKRYEETGVEVDVDLDKQPAEGEALIISQGGAFLVKGSMREVAAKLEAESWANFELAESSDPILIRTAQVVAVRGGVKAHRRSAIGFAARSGSAS